ncbi:MAG TPA: gluconokinase [Thermoanaerobaculia bacterium]|nr:gluconokinase [Thermoanaerobaculia bacterium]
MIIVVMGVAGAGKSTVAAHLARRLGFRFVDGDSLHPPRNVRKMSAGRPLSDDDREEWLRSLGGLVAEADRSGTGLVLACSALREVYRRTLRERGGDVRFVYLRASPSLAAERAEARSGHFMPAALVASQFEALEEPGDALVVDAARPPEALADEIVRALAPPGSR